MVDKNNKKTTSVYEVLSKINANKYKKEITLKNGKTLSYLSWTDALAGVLNIYPETTWRVHEFPVVMTKYKIVEEETKEYVKFNKTIAFGTEICEYFKVPYLKTPLGFFVKVSVIINGFEREEILPVLDKQHKYTSKPNSFDINTSIKRCLAKCLALHGLGLYIYRGEDLPNSYIEEKPAIPTKPVKVVEIKSKSPLKDAKEEK